MEKHEARYTVKGLLGKQVLYTARQEGRVLTLDAPDDNATFRTTILDMQTLMNQGVSTLVLKTGKTSTTLNLTLLCQDQKPGTRSLCATSAAALTSPWASAAAATSSLVAEPQTTVFLSLLFFPRYVRQQEGPLHSTQRAFLCVQMVSSGPLSPCSDA